MWSRFKDGDGANEAEILKHQNMSWEIMLIKFFSLLGVIMITLIELFRMLWGVATAFTLRLTWYAVIIEFKTGSMRAQIVVWKQRWAPSQWTCTREKKIYTRRVEPPHPGNSECNFGRESFGSRIVGLGRAVPFGFLLRDGIASKNLVSIAVSIF